MIRAPGQAARLILAAMALALAGCGSGDEDDLAAGRPVEIAVIEPSALAGSVLLTGDVEARKDVDIAFRVAGRMAERPVNVGDRVKAGQVLAKLDPATEQNALKAAQAALVAAQGEAATAASEFGRQQRLWDQGFTTRPRFDQAKQALETARSRLDDAEARVDTARERLGFTELRADAEGLVTARGAEPGEVVQPGRMIVRLARDDGRDAVFDAPATVLRAGSADRAIRVALAADPAVVAQGRVREVSPQADPVTGTFRVRVGLDHPPEAMRLGATVTGSFDLVSNVVVSIPARALTTLAGAPAVWVIDPATSTVSLRPVEMLRFDGPRVVVGQGLEPGEVIVAAGAQALRPGQKVKPLGAARKAASLVPPPEAGPQEGRG